MLTLGKGSKNSQTQVKRGSNKPNFIGALESGLNRRAFLRQSSVALLFASIAGCKPAVTLPSNVDEAAKTTIINSQSDYLSDIFPITNEQQTIIKAVQMQLFPADGDGPSAEEINAFKYLQWALTDSDNQADGDGEFIVKGVGWLDGLSEQTQGDKFIKLSSKKQDQVLRQISQSGAGENWLSLLIYYLVEALVFDPVYGGNPDSIGWKWLKHQPGFPRPTEQTIYRSFS